MTWNEATAEPPMDKTQLLHKGSLLLAMAVVALLLVLNRHNTLVFGVIGALGAILVPALYFLLRRLLHAVRQRQMEDRMVMQTREFLRKQEPWCPPAAAAPESADALSRRMTPRGFKDVLAGVRTPLAGSNLVIFDALPRLYAVRNYCEHRLADLAATLPAPVTVPWNELLPGEQPRPQRQKASIPGGRAREARRNELCADSKA